MAHAAATNFAPAAAGKSKVGKAFAILAWAALVAIAVAFVLKYVFHYYLNYNAVAFDPYWPRRAGLLLHITGGMVALLTAPWLTRAAPALWAAVGAQGELADARLPGALAWGGLPRGARVERVGALFPRLDAEGNVARRAG